tara:strand:- start:769 stop:870 length:102 start_codon:yes stop_codon:yes gene_type:complete
VKPGLKEFALIPKSENSNAKDLVKEISAPLDEA